MRFLIYRCWSLFAVLFLTYTNEAHANIVGTDFQLFNPTHDVDHYFTVYSSRTLLPGQFNFGLFVDGAMNTLPYEAPTVETKNLRSGYKDAIVQTDVHASIGLMKGWDVGFSLPLVFQTLKEDTSKVIFDAEGITEFRISSKLRLVGDANSGLAAVAILSQNQIRDNPYMGDENNLNYQLHLALNGQLSRKLDGAINAGYRMRDPGVRINYTENNVSLPAPMDPIEDQILFSFALGYDFNKHWRLVWEAYGASPVDEVFMQTYREQTPAETVLGIRYRPTRDMYWYFGGGSELIHSIASPDARVFLGMNWTPRLWDKKKVVEPKPVEPPVVEEVPPPVVEPEIVAPTAEEKPAEQFVAKNILFEYNSDSKILRSSRDELARIGEYLKGRGFDRLSIEGHTDSKGTDEYNLGLSQRRADTIKNYLVHTYGFDAERVFAKGLGESQPVTENETAEGRKQNRRVEFKIFDKPEETDVPMVPTAPTKESNSYESLDTPETSPAAIGNEAVEIESDTTTETLEPTPASRKNSQKSATSKKVRKRAAPVIEDTPAEVESSELTPDVGGEVSTPTSESEADKMLEEALGEGIQ